MKIYGISDLHGHLPKTPECDVLCICGDVIGLVEQRDTELSRHWWYNNFTKWVNAQPCAKVIVTPGNHDFFIEKAYKEGWLSEMKSDLSVRTNDKLVILIDELYTYNDFKIYGTPWVAPITFQENRWAFTTNNCLDVNNIKRDPFDNIPADVDILLTHESPAHNLYLDTGIVNISDLKLHLHGHWHAAPSQPSIDTYNVSYLNDSYNIDTTKTLNVHSVDLKPEVAEEVPTARPDNAFTPVESDTPLNDVAPTDYETYVMYK